ncbi:hypothetical protein [Xanthomonas medicagonis]|uniref:hypothetical protein n=1 Tax=Xanthomonas medicagonis TaxID=3160841 RepID=UPI003512583B
MKTPIAIPIRLVALGVASALLAGPALASQVEEAQVYVTKQTAQGQNVLKTGCSKVQSKNGKNVCFLKEYPQVVLIGNINGRKAAAVREEHATLATLNQWNVASVEVGSAFIEPLPCSVQDSKFGCGGFTEGKLSGTEVYWAGYQNALVDSQTAAKCTAPDYRSKVESAYRAVSLNGLVLHDLVHGKSARWRETLSDDVASMGRVFEAKQQAVIDLQAFVADDGKMSVFDPQGLSGNTRFHTCWSQALIILGDLIARDG